MNIVLCQLDTIWENRQANCAKLSRLLTAHHPTPGSLLVLPEMFPVGFSMNIQAIVKDESNSTERTLAELARFHRCCILAGQATSTSDGRGRNEALFFDPAGNITNRYQKLHPFSYANEDRFFEPGTTISTFPAGEFTLAPFICYDLRFPEIFRQAIRRGANLLVNIANWPTSRLDHWLTLLKARAIENQAYVVGVNRCGSDPNLVYPGHSQVIDPRGNVLCDAGTQEILTAVNIELPPLLDYRKSFPALDDMR